MGVRVLLPLLFLVLLPFLVSSQQLPQPDLYSVTNIVTTSSSQVFLQWTIPSGCPGGVYGCFFTLHCDYFSERVAPFATNVFAYQFTITDVSTWSAANHTFSITADAYYPALTNSSANVTIPVSPTPYVPPPAPPTNPQDPPSIVGDPQFTGLRGQSYQVHGAPNEVFNIISDTDFQYNSRFVYLADGQCPTIDGRKLDTACFTHPGTYLGELALMTSAGDHLYLRAGAADEGFAMVSLNGEDLEADDEDVQELRPLKGRDTPFVVRNSSHVVEVQMGNFHLQFTNSDLFVNQRVRMLDASAQTSHGLMGQTWSGKIYDADATIPWIEGDVWDYALADHQMFSHRFVYNQFKAGGQEEEVKETKHNPLFKMLKDARSQAHSHAHGSGADL